MYSVNLINYLTKLHKPSNLIAQLLAGNNRNLLTYPLVGVKVQGQACVVFLNYHPRRLLDGLGSYSARLHRTTTVCTQNCISQSHPLAPVTDVL